jgi:hypothetical protein
MAIYVTDESYCRAAFDDHRPSLMRCTEFFSSKIIRIAGLGRQVISSYDTERITIFHRLGLLVSFLSF